MAQDQGLQAFLGAALLAGASGLVLWAITRPPEATDTGDGGTGGGEAPSGRLPPVSNRPPWATFGTR